MLLLKNGTILTMNSQGTVEEGDVLIENGIITKIGQGIEEECQTIDAEGYYILPGFIDAHSHVGLCRFDIGTDQGNELTEPVTAELNAWESIDPESPLFEEIVTEGITTSCIVPGSGNVIGGWGVVMKSLGKNLKKRVIKNPAVLKGAMGVNPKGIYAASSRMPMTRMGIAFLMRDYFQRVQKYMKNKEESDESKQVENWDEGMEHGIPVLKKEMPFKIHAYQHDMMTALEIAKEFDIHITLDHAQGASDFIEELKDEHVQGVLFGPVVMGLGTGETCKADYEALPMLDRAGVTVGVITDGPVVCGQVLVDAIGEAVRKGMDPVRALGMITCNAAKILQCEDRIGSLEVGKDADILMYKGFPGLDVTAQNQLTILDGEIVYRKTEI